MEDIGVASGRPDVDKLEGSAAAFGLARVLLVLERPALAELIALALSQSMYATRAAFTVTEVDTTVVEWQPQLLILDMGPRRDAAHCAGQPWDAHAGPDARHRPNAPG